MNIYNKLYDNGEWSSIINSINKINVYYLINEQELLSEILVQKAEVEPQLQNKIFEKAKNLTYAIKDDSITDALLTQYDLSSTEGIALMCLAESLLRIPDQKTIDLLIKEKLEEGNWNNHVGKSKSFFVNTSTIGMLVAKKVVSSEKSYANILTNLTKRLGKNITRQVILQTMKILGKSFILGQNIEEGLTNSDKHSHFLYSFDMLGEAAKTTDDAEKYYNLYLSSIIAVGNHSKQNKNQSIQKQSTKNVNGISVKLSALHPRYEFNQPDAIKEVIEKITQLCLKAKEYNIGIFIDAEESHRLWPSLVVLTALCMNKELSTWDGLGFVVQAYQKRAFFVLDKVLELAKIRENIIKVRLVKGAYWDYEIKYAQESGHSDYPVFTKKSHTDIAYRACVKKLLSFSTEYIYPCFATHNTHSIAYILENTTTTNRECEFQCLHGMGVSLYSEIIDSENIKCRVYAPVGDYKELLSYLIRRLLENGANSSFINKRKKITDIELLIQDPLTEALPFAFEHNLKIKLPRYVHPYISSIGLNMENPLIDPWKNLHGKIDYKVYSIINGKDITGTQAYNLYNPAKNDEQIGEASFAQEEQIKLAIDTSIEYFKTWQGTLVSKRATILRKAANLYEDNMDEFIHILCKEAGKTMKDAIAEIKEGVDFLRYYAEQAEEKMTGKITLPSVVGEENIIEYFGRGVFVCISPWNFPLAIFIGQIAAALATGNTVVAKPAESTNIIAYKAVMLLYEAGLPYGALQLVLGKGANLGPIIFKDNRIAGVVFTGSMGTAQRINRDLAMRENAPIIPLIAETGGINAMIVDSSALSEQVTTDVINSAFQSAGQRCSALRVLFVQDEIADNQIKMIKGALEVLNIGNPADMNCDVGPIIDGKARDNIKNYCDNMDHNKLIAETKVDEEILKSGYFIAPKAYEISGMNEINQEIFGPILHIVRYNQCDLDKVIQSINDSGYALTFGVHSRLTTNVEYIRSKIEVGNVYINRNQIGAVVGSQPFGGFKLSGTGPKAGGPDYITRFVIEKVSSNNTTAIGGNTELMKL